MTAKRFHWDWKTGRMKDTYSDCHATKNMRLIERQINDACRSYEKQIAKLENENKQLKRQVGNLEHTRDFCADVCADCDRLEKENKELRKENEELKQSYKEFEDECQSTFNAMSRKQNDSYRKNFKLKEENEELKYHLDRTEKELQEYKDFMSLG